MKTDIYNCMHKQPSPFSQVLTVDINKKKLAGCTQHMATFIGYSPSVIGITKYILYIFLYIFM